MVEFLDFELMKASVKLVRDVLKVSRKKMIFFLSDRQKN